MTRRSNLFTSSNLPSPLSSESTPQLTSAGGQQGASRGEPSGETLPDVPDLIIVPPAVSAEVAGEELEIRREIERFRGSKTAGEFIAAVTLLKILDFASADLNVIMEGDDPGFQLCLLEAARVVEALERASRASVRGSVAALALQPLRQAQPRPAQDSDVSIRR
jgi:hypothetical protein